MKTAIIAAMEPELEELVSRMDKASEVKRAGFTFYSGTLAGYEAVLLLSGIGKVNAAVGTALLIEDYHPDAVINTGVAGGFDKTLQPGDIVLSEEVRHHDVDALPFGYEAGQVPGMPAAYTADAGLLRLAAATAPEELSVQVKTGLIVSGDSFIHEPDEGGQNTPVLSPGSGRRNGSGGGRPNLLSFQDTVHHCPQHF